MFSLNPDQQTDIWQGFSMNNFAQRSKEESEGIVHPTMKPIKLIAQQILNSTEEGAKVLDLCGGSGSTLMACEQTKRKAYLCEIDPKYCSTIIERWEQYTGKKAERLN